MTLFEVKNLCKSYGKIKALRGVSFKVPRGRVGLLGPNGAGKTTLLKILLCLLKPEKGEIYFQGQKVSFKERQYLRQLGYMPEEFGGLKNHSGLTYLMCLAELTGLSQREALRRAHRVLYYVGIGEERYRPLHTLSYGQKQRLLFAQALIHDPDILLLDEPTTGLDPEARREFLDHLTHLAEEAGKGFLLSSHILEDIQQVCDYVIVLKQGECIYQGSLDQWLERQKNLYSLRWSVPPPLDFEERFSKVGGEILEKKGEEWIVRLSERNLSLLFQIARQKGIFLRQAVPLQRRLEEVFLKSVQS